MRTPRCLLLALTLVVAGATHLSAAPIVVTYDGTFLTRYVADVGYDPAFEPFRFIGTFMIDPDVQSPGLTDGPWGEEYIDYFHLDGLTTPLTPLTRDAFPSGTFEPSFRWGRLSTAGTFPYSELAFVEFEESPSSPWGMAVRELWGIHGASHWTVEEFLAAAIAWDTEFMLRDEVQIDGGFGVDYFGSARILAMSATPPAAVPEPALMVLLGLAAGTAYVRRRRSAA